MPITITRLALHTINLFETFLHAAGGPEAVAGFRASRAPTDWLADQNTWPLPEFRRRGVGRALLTHIEQLAQSLGLAGVRLLVRPDNAAARALYQQAGFRGSETLFCEKPNR